MRAWFVPVAALVLVGGCKTDQSLRDNTVVTAATLADVNYQQILTNVAMFENNPAVLPSVAKVGSGSVSVADHATLNVAPTYVPTLSFPQQLGAGLPIFSIFFNPSCDRLVTENWALQAVESPHRLRNIGCAFQILVRNSEDCPDADSVRHLEKALMEEELPLEILIPRGWYQVGKKHDVPKNACYVGHHCDTYVWVLPDGVGGLSRFTLTVLQLAGGGEEKEAAPEKKSEKAATHTNPHNQDPIDMPRREFGTR